MTIPSPSKFLFFDDDDDDNRPPLQFFSHRKDSTRALSIAVVELRRREQYSNCQTTVKVQISQHKTLSLRLIYKGQSFAENYYARVAVLVHVS